MTFSKLMELCRELEADFKGDWREIADKMLDEEPDFEVAGHRFIMDDSTLDDIMQDELESDLYVLGCFNASFLSNILHAPQEVIEAAQEADAREAIGKWIVDSGVLDDLQSEYVKADGYGHHFAHYDGNEHEYGDYLAFRVS